MEIINRVLTENCPGKAMRQLRYMILQVMRFREVGAEKLLNSRHLLRNILTHDIKRMGLIEQISDQINKERKQRSNAIDNNPY